MKRYYSLECLEDFYRHEEPTLSEKMVKEKAKNLHRMLNTLDIRWARSNRKFYDHNKLDDFSQNF